MLSETSEDYPPDSIQRDSLLVDLFFHSLSLPNFGTAEFFSG